MTNEEAYDVFVKSKQCEETFYAGDCPKIAARRCSDCPYNVPDKDYGAARDAAIEMFERSTPKKVTWYYEGYKPIYVCPHCGAKYPLKEMERTPRYFDTVCGVCHGVMDWEDIDYSEDLELEW